MRSLLKRRALTVSLFAAVLLLECGFESAAFGADTSDRTKTAVTLNPSKRTAGSAISKRLSLSDGSASFIENRGQFGPRVKFSADFGTTRVWFADDGVVFDVRREKIKASSAKARGHEPLMTATKTERFAFKEKFSSKNGHISVTRCDPRPGIYNFFLGNDSSKWQRNVQRYGQIVYNDVWPGVDVRFVTRDGNLEQEFVVHPGADPESIKVAYEGAGSIQKGENGSLSIPTPLGELQEVRPSIYQESGGRRSARTGRFKLVSRHAYGFHIGSFRRDTDLVIDPLLYSTFLGGSSIDYGAGIAADTAGNTYVAGFTESPDFPLTTGALQSTYVPDEGFIAKLGPNGLPVYSTFLGPVSGYFGISGLAVDSTGRAYVTGMVGGGTAFPTTPNAYRTYCGDSIFLSVLNTGGDSLAYSTCFGDESSENGVGVRALGIDAAGRAYLTGSALGTTPVTSGAYQSTNRDGQNAFLAVLDPTLSGTASLIYSTFLGGSGGDVGYAVAADAFGNAYVAGVTWSNNFPITAGAYQTRDKNNPQSEGGPGGTGFVSKINPNANGSASLVYSTYLGGSGGSFFATDRARGITVDSSGNAYITGIAGSSDFPVTTGAFETSCPEGGCGFITKLDAGGSHLIYSSFINVWDANAVAIDRLGNAYIAGDTADGHFPVTPNAFQPSYHPGGPSGYDGFLLELDPTGTTELYGTYLGGSSDDRVSALAVNTIGDVYMTGSTTSADFPVSSYPFQGTLKNSSTNCPYSGAPCPDAFVTELALGAGAGLTITSIVPTAGGNVGSVTPEIIGSGFHAGATAQLKCGGQTVAGSNVVFGPLGRTFNATFDLTSSQPGTCDVVVTNVDGSSATLAGAFSVQQGGAARIATSKVSTPVIRPPLDQPAWPTNVNYLITVTNIGNVDANGLAATEFLQPWFTLKFTSPTASQVSEYPPPAAQNGEEYDSLIEWQVPQIPAGSTSEFTYGVVLDGSVPAGQAVSGPVAVLPAPLAATLTPQQGGPSPYSCVQPIPGVNFCLNTTRQACLNALGVCLVTATTRCLLAGPAYQACLLTSVSSCGTGYAACLALYANSAGSCSTACQQVQGGSQDPNQLNGLSGAGAQQWIAGTQPLPYSVSFGNESTATAPAQQVVVTQTLDPSLDLTTLNLAAITIPSNAGASSITVSVPATLFAPVSGVDEYATTVDLRPSQGMLVTIDAKLNPTTSTVTWTFNSINPLTGQPYPINLANGFLPPGSGASLMYSIKPKTGLATGTTISSQASVVFNTNAAISTNAWMNEIDNTPPTSAVAALPATESSASFAVNWSGTDVGSGIASYTIYVSDNGGPFTAWQTNTTSTSATYAGSTGHTYGFYSIASDLVGNVESAKTAAEATTTVSVSNCATDVSSQVTAARGGLRLNHATNTFVQSITLTNTGAPLTNVSLVLDSLGANATLVNAGGVTQCDAPLGSPWIATAGTIATGQSVTVNLNFSDPTTAGINYTTRVLAGSGQQ